MFFDNHANRVTFEVWGPYEAHDSGLRCVFLEVHNSKVARGMSRTTPNRVTSILPPREARYRSFTGVFKKDCLL